MRRLALALLFALPGAGCDLSYNNSRFTCDGSTPCPTGLECVGGYCLVSTSSGTSGGGTTGGGTIGGTTGSGTTGTTTTGGTTGAAVCTNPVSGLCPPQATTDYLSCEFGCCPPQQPYECGYTALCYDTPEAAASDCADAGQGCSSCSNAWCGTPADSQGCSQGAGYCGSGKCCDLSTPWFCDDPDGGTCYALQSDALAHCPGNTCSLCSPQCQSPSGSANCPGGISCGTGNCCPTELPFFCPGSGFCFASNAEAYYSCGDTCTTCQ